MKADINVTPLIDVLLVLLIIFMLVTPARRPRSTRHCPSRRTTPRSRQPHGTWCSRSGRRTGA